MMSKDSIALFFISLISLSGIFAILAFSQENFIATGQMSFIDTILDMGKRQFNELFTTTKPVQKRITEPVTEEKYNEELEEELSEENLESFEEELLKEPSEELIDKPQRSLDYLVVGPWRPHAQNIAYDAGAVNAIKRPVTRWLTISEDSTWEFGSTGTWKIEEITEEDWKKWGMAPYGPTKKIVLTGWNDGIGDGPIDEGTEGVDFIWVIYHSEKLSLGPATIQIKFGH